MNIEHETIEFDVLFVGGGPAGLAGAIRLSQLAREKNMELEVALIEKGGEIGAHALSGAILNPIALEELIPEYAEKGCPLEASVRGDEFYYLTENRRLPMLFTPRYLHNAGNHVISLSRFCRWLANTAEEMGVNLFPGFAAKEVLYAEDGKTVAGVRTGDQGLDKDGQPKANFEPGIDLRAKVTVFAEGARGSLTKSVTEKLDIAAGRQPQVYETGIKEVIQLSDSHYFSSSRGNVVHLLGYPLGLSTPGGGFVYEMKENRISLGYLVGLGYADPMLDPYRMFIQFKRHPFISGIIQGGKVVEQGARTVTTGGYYTIPRLAVDGAVFCGGCAGFHNPPALKGIHVSMKSGMLAAEGILDALEKSNVTATGLQGYPNRFQESWVRKELYEGRNFSQALSKKGIMKFVHLGAQYLTGGRGIFDPMPLEEDCTTLSRAPDGETEARPRIDKQVYDGERIVDKLTGVFLSKTTHREDQPSHLIVHDTDLCVNICYPAYRSPCTRFCPAQVYEMEIDEETSQRRLKLNPSNCLHCKTCDVKDPYRNITWTCPEGGEGPGYTVG